MRLLTASWLGLATACGPTTAVLSGLDHDAGAVDTAGPDDAPGDEPDDNGPDDEPDDDEEPDDDDDEPDDDDTVRVEPYAFFAFAEYGVEVSGGPPRAVAYVRPSGDRVPPRLRLYFVDEAFLETGDETFTCEVVLSLRSSKRLERFEWDEEVEDGSTRRMRHVGVRWEPDDTRGETSCDWFPLSWGDPVEAVQQHTWGVGWGEFRPEIAEFMQEDPTLAPYAVGSSIHSSVFSQGGFAGNFALGLEVDSNVVIQTDDAGQPVLLDREDVGAKPPPEMVLSSRPFYGFLAERLRP